MATHQKQITIFLGYMPFQIFALFSWGQVESTCAKEMGEELMKEKF